jgi:hypothetical protein
MTLTGVRYMPDSSVLGRLHVLTHFLLRIDANTSVEKRGPREYAVRLEKDGEWIETLFECDSPEDVDAHRGELAAELRSMEFQLVTRTERRADRDAVQRRLGL